MSEVLTVKLPDSTETTQVGMSFGNKAVERPVCPDRGGADTDSRVATLFNALTSLLDVPSRLVVHLGMLDPRRTHHDHRAQSPTLLRDRVVAQRYDAAGAYSACMDLTIDPTRRRFQTILAYSRPRLFTLGQFKQATSGCSRGGDGES